MCETCMWVSSCRLAFRDDACVVARRAAAVESPERRTRRSALESSHSLTMRILFVMRHAGYARNFEWVLRELDDRGHEVQLGFERDWPEEQEIVTRLAADCEHISFGRVPTRRDQWSGLSFDLRNAMSYLRYLRPEYRNANKIRARLADKAPDFVVKLSQQPVVRSRAGVWLMNIVLRSCEGAVPRDAGTDEYLKEGAFDLVLTTPLVDGPSQVEWLRSAKAAGVPALFAAASWDNLTLKGLAFERPDRTYVWNDIQRGEAAKYHRIPPKKVAVVGAHTFDHWFGWRPSTSRKEFCDRIGLDPDRPFLLYVCSSRLIAKDERPLVRRWIESIREHDRLRAVGVLVRPHVDGTVWLENPLADLSNTAVWPPAGANPFYTERRHEYYDSLYHSSAVVGINTTALIEAAIVGRRTFTYVAPEVHGGQEGTLHFHYLSRDNGGALTLARSLNEHASHLAEALKATSDDPWRRPFLERFVRPHGLERAAAPLLVDDLEAFAERYEPARPARARPFGRSGLTALQIPRRLREVAAAKPNLRKRARHWVVVQRARARRARFLAATAVRHALRQ
jgi:hypothetical protein